jgi:hypothetical protein
MLFTNRPKSHRVPEPYGVFRDLSAVRRNSRAPNSYRREPLRITFWGQLRYGLASDEIQFCAMNLCAMDAITFAVEASDVESPSRQ